MPFDRQKARESIAKAFGDKGTYGDESPKQYSGGSSITKTPAEAEKASGPSEEAIQKAREERLARKAKGQSQDTSGFGQ